MERIGVISDTHLTVPDETLKRIVRVYFSQVDLIVHLGDYVDYRVA
ncbi:MAG: metallophosphoesterase, partial [Deltaproteobacteria bacterium]|nr:metallophosphoesterase [Deltaproteobacteria bacterium]